MRRLTLFTAAVFLTTAIPSPGVAQLQPTDRVRILTVNGFTMTGVLTEMSRDSLQVSVDGVPAWVRRDDIALLERSAGRYRKFARNFAVTIGSAAAIGGMLGAITWKECVSNEFLGCLMAPETRADAFILGAAVGGVLSAPIGVILGLAINYDRWEPAQGSGARQSRLSLTPRFDRGLGLSASISF